MMKTRYHPLVDGDTEGTDKRPLFMTEDEAAARDNHSYYLEEMIPRFYQLRRVSKKAAIGWEGFRVHCPRCGAVMDRISSGKGNRQLPMYMCRACIKERKV